MAYLCHRVIGFRIGDVFFVCTEDGYLGADHIVLFLQRNHFPQGRGGSLHTIAFWQTFEVVALGVGNQSCVFVVPIAVYSGGTVSFAVPVRLLVGGRVGRGGSIYTPFAMERRYLPLQKPELSAPSDFGWFCVGDSPEQNRGRVREAGHWRVSFRSKHPQTNMGHQLRLSSFLLAWPQG
ncbi:hypothetical protein CH063_08228 [Colletotrichum higginsianum]|uniref:Uncharacterized protein n=1 Tax=Colletotrichum higginsianum (strain IMI 349063) TaxID=759273 RepID=H1V920_COLHI|nr:hypothetical protein CH063_08228 [Colletotrichum higginsianum]